MCLLSFFKSQKSACHISNPDNWSSVLPQLFLADFYFTENGDVSLLLVLRKIIFYVSCSTKSVYKIVSLQMQHLF